VQPGGPPPRADFLGRLRTPEVDAGQPAEVVALFCGRLLQLLVWEPQLRNCRLAVAAAERVPGSSTAYFDIIFTNACRRLNAYMTTAPGTAPRAGTGPGPCSKRTAGTPTPSRCPAPSGASRTTGGTRGSSTTPG
jgi:hypothetical protein